MAERKTRLHLTAVIRRFWYRREFGTSWNFAKRIRCSLSCAIGSMRRRITSTTMPSFYLSATLLHHENRHRSPRPYRIGADPPVAIGFSGSRDRHGRQHDDAALHVIIRSPRLPMPRVPLTAPPNSVLTLNATVHNIIDCICEFVPDVRLSFVNCLIMKQLSYVQCQSF